MLNPNQKSKSKSNAKIKEEIRQELLKHKLENNKAAFQHKRKFPETVDRNIENKKKKIQSFCFTFH